MNIRKLSNSDYHLLESFLVLYSESSMILRGNARNAGLEYVEKDFSGEYWASFDGLGKINGVLAHYWNGNLFMQAPDELILTNLVLHFKSASKRAIAGVLGPDTQAQCVIQTLGLNSAEYACNKMEGLYSLDLASLKIPPGYNPSTTKLINVKDVDRNILRKWMRAFTIEALGAEDNQQLDGNVEGTVDRMVANMNHWVLLVDDVPVSLSGWNSKLPTIVQVGPVWTPPEHRNKGYARLIVSLTLQNSQQEGIQQAVLFTANPAAVKAYQSIGFTQIGTFRLSLLKNPVLLTD